MSKKFYQKKLLDTFCPKIYLLKNFWTNLKNYLNYLPFLVNFKKIIINF